MKSPFLSLLFLVIAATQNAAASDVINVKAGALGGVKLGTSGLGALRKLPFVDAGQRKIAEEKFLSREKARGKDYWVEAPEFHGVKYGFDFSGKLFGFMVNTGDVRTSEGVGVGSQIRDFVKAYGPPKSTVPSVQGRMLRRFSPGPGVAIQVFTVEDPGNKAGDDMKVVIFIVHHG